MLTQERLGAAVRDARTAAGLSIEQVSARTRIRPGLLRDLESGCTARCGGTVYARGHLRAVAAVTGADPDVLLSALADLEQPAGDPVVSSAAADQPAAHPGRARRPAPGPELRPLDVLPPTAREPGRPRWGLAAALAAAAVAVLMLVGALHGAPAPAPVSALPAPAAAPAPRATTAPPPAAAPAALRLEVGKGRSWVAVRTSSGRSLFEGVLAAGSAREFTDPSRLSITLGNAGVVTVGCGGSSAAAGPSGKVRRFVCAPDGLAPA